MTRRPCQFISIPKASSRKILLQKPRNFRSTVCWISVVLLTNSWEWFLAFLSLFEFNFLSVSQLLVPLDLLWISFGCLPTWDFKQPKISTQNTKSGHKEMGNKHGRGGRGAEEQGRKSKRVTEFLKGWTFFSYQINKYCVHKVWEQRALPCTASESASLYNRLWRWNLPTFVRFEMHTPFRQAIPWTQILQLGATSCYLKKTSKWRVLLNFRRDLMKGFPDNQRTNKLYTA